MAEKKETTKKKTTKKVSKELMDMEVNDLKRELQKVILEVRTGRETDTSKVKKIKKAIARKLTVTNQSNDKK